MMGKPARGPECHVRRQGNNETAGAGNYLLSHAPPVSKMLALRCAGAFAAPRLHFRLHRNQTTDLAHMASR